MGFSELNRRLNDTRFDGRLVGSANICMRRRFAADEGNGNAATGLSQGVPTGSRGRRTGYLADFGCLVLGVAPNPPAKPGYYPSATESWWVGKARRSRYLLNVR